MEKALKAVLVVHEHPVPLARLPDDLGPDFGYELSTLDEFAGVRRYEVWRMTKKVLDWSKTNEIV